MGRANPSSRRARASGRFEALPSRDRAAILALRQEIRRSMTDLRLPDHPRPFFISHLVKVNRTVEIWGKYGSIFQSRNDVRTSLYTEVRVGSHRSDQTLDGGLDIDLSQKHSYEWTEGPVELEPDALRYAIWRLTQFKYEEALEQYFDKRKLGVQQRLDGRSSGFTREPPFRHYQKQAPIEFPVAEWEELIRRQTSRFKRSKAVIDPHIEMRAREQASYYANSEGSEFVIDETFYEAILRGWIQGPEGHFLSLNRLFYTRHLDELPDEDAVREAVDHLEAELRVLAGAEILPPYEGPALLSGAAAGLLFHEALGHRLEGERLVSRSEGQTFSDRIGQRILPPGIDVYDDPTVARFEGADLYGHYLVDDEGVPSRRVHLVKDGVLVDFLLSRTTAGDSNRSNGHGRNATFEDPMARMANLIVEGAEPRPWEALKEALLEELRARGLGYGLIIRDVEGGETSTSSYDFQAFKGVPTEVYKVDARTGRETRVRGVEYIGTPLTSLQRILAVGEGYHVDNSYCVAESGAVPVSTIAPPVLVSQIELQRASGQMYLPPILPAPWRRR